MKEIADIWNKEKGRSDERTIPKIIRNAGGAEGGKFTKKGHTRTAYNNFVKELRQDSRYTMKEIGALWRKEKGISEERTIPKIIGISAEKLSDQMKSNVAKKHDLKKSAELTLENKKILHEAFKSYKKGDIQLTDLKKLYKTLMKTEFENLKSTIKKAKKENNPRSKANKKSAANIKKIEKILKKKLN